MKAIIFNCRIYAYSHFTLGFLVYQKSYLSPNLSVKPVPNPLIIYLYLIVAVGLMSLVIFAVILVILCYRLSKIGQRPRGCPPGPPTLPLIGNLHLMPKEKGHLQFQKWANEYGPIYSLVLGTQIMIVLSSDVAVKDLLDKRSGIYSSRPDMYLGSDIVSGGFRMVLMVSLSRQLSLAAESQSDLANRNTASVGEWSEGLFIIVSISKLRGPISHTKTSRARPCCWAFSTILRNSSVISEDTQIPYRLRCYLDFEHWTFMIQS